MAVRLLDETATRVAVEMTRHRPWPGWRRRRCMSGCGVWPCGRFWDLWSALVQQVRPGEYVDSARLVPWWESARRTIGVGLDGQPDGDGWGSW